MRKISIIFLLALLLLGSGELLAQKKGKKTANTKKANPTLFGSWDNLNKKFQNAGFGCEYECTEGNQTTCNSHVIEFGLPPKPGERRNGIMVTYEKLKDVEIQTVTIALFLSNADEKDVAVTRLVEYSKKLLKELKINYPEGLEPAITKMNFFEYADVAKECKISVIPKKKGRKVKLLMVEIYGS